MLNLSYKSNMNIKILPDTNQQDVMVGTETRRFHRTNCQ